jgi:hypothetical protein
MTGYTVVHDAIAANISSLPAGQAAGYCTGSGVVPWTAADWASHPGAVRIDQSPVNTALDETADILDVEYGAATFADAGGWALAARGNFATAARPGQRAPAIYASLSNVTAVANALAAAKLTDVGLFVANWNLTQPEAGALLAVAGGPYPIIGVQFQNNGLYDTSVFSPAWLAAVSGKDPAPVPTVTGWSYSAPAGLIGTVSRQVALAWSASTAAGYPAPASYTVELSKNGAVDRTVVAAGLSAVIGGLSDGAHSVRVWANGGEDAPTGSTVDFTV